jgi:hypothetical protein
MLWIFIWDDKVEKIGQKGDEFELDSFCSLSIDYARWAFKTAPDESRQPTPSQFPPNTLLRELNHFQSKHFDQGR